MNRSEAIKSLMGGFFALGDLGAGLSAILDAESPYNRSPAGARWLQGFSGGAQMMAGLFGSADVIVPNPMLASAQLIFTILSSVLAGAGDIWARVGTHRIPPR
jgi:hypothetical protein